MALLLSVLDDLRLLNFVAFLLHGIICLCVPLFSDMNLNISLYDAVLNVTVIGEGDAHVVTPIAFETKSKLPFVALLFTVEFVTALFHFLFAFVIPDAYNRCVRDCNNFFRWLEYSYTSSTMFVLIAHSCGVVEVYLLVTLAVLMSTTMVMGQLQEMVNRPKDAETWTISNPYKRCLPLVYGFVPFLTAYSIVFIRFSELASTSVTHVVSGELRGIPEFVYFVVFGEFVLFSVFPVIMVRQTLSEPRTYKTYEREYVLLSFLSKSFLAIILLSNSVYLSAS